MSETISRKTILILLIFTAITFSLWLCTKSAVHLSYWLFGIMFGIVLQHFGLCFVSSASDPFLTGSTSQFRGILVGILTATLGITVIKYLSYGTLDFLNVYSISLPLMLGAFVFGTGMVLAGCCASGMFIRLAEGYTVHIITIISVIAGYLFASSHYKTVWSPFIAASPMVFMPEKFGWFIGVSINIAITLLIYFIAFKWEKHGSSSTSATYLTGGILLGLLSIAHYIVLESGWSVTGAFYWLKPFADMLISGSTDIDFKSEEIFLSGIGSNLRNIALFAGALLSAFYFSSFKFRRISSLKQPFRSISGGLLMGYGACIAGGCNITSFFTAAASLSLSAWVFMIFLFAGAFVGTRILFKLL